MNKIEPCGINKMPKKLTTGDQNSSFGLQRNLFKIRWMKVSQLQSWVCGVNSHDLHRGPVPALHLRQGGQPGGARPAGPEREGSGARGRVKSALSFTQFWVWDVQLAEVPEPVELKSQDSPVKKKRSRLIRIIWIGWCNNMPLKIWQFSSLFL